MSQERSLGEKSKLKSKSDNCGSCGAKSRSRSKSNGKTKIKRQSVERNQVNLPRIPVSIFEGNKDQI